MLKQAREIDPRLLRSLFDGVIFKSEMINYLSSGGADHGELSGLTDDDHTQYARTDGTRAITGEQTFEAGILTDTIGEETTDAGVTIDTLLIKDGNIPAVDYAFVTANDGATDVTAAQLEELTDASETTLHTHANIGDGPWLPLAGGDVIGATTFGDGGTTNYSEFETDGDLVLNGTANIAAVDYAFVTANDGDTDVTAAELEELTDGSDTELHGHLHSHETTSSPPVCFSSYIDVKARNAVYNLHGGLDALDTAHDLGAGDLVVTCGTGKIMLAIIAANDFAGDITVTGTTVDRNTGAETGADTDTITIDALTTDNSSTDASGNVVHAFTGAYITSKWFKGSITISSADTDVTDMDTYQASFEQINDSTDITLKTFDITAAATNNAAWLYAYLYTLHVTGDKCNVDTESSIDLPAAEVTSGNTYRLRRGEINESFSGATDGFWVEMFPGPLASTYWENINVKVWTDVGTDGTTEGDPIPPVPPPTSINFDEETTGITPTNVDVSAGNWLTQLITADSNAYTPPGFTKEARLTTTATGRFHWALDAVPTDVIRFEALVLSNLNVNSQQIYVGGLSENSWAPDDRVEFLGYGATNLEYISGRYVNDGAGAVVFGTDTAVSPVIAHTRWYLMQAQWTQSTGAVTVEWIRLEDSSSTGVDNLTVPVGWNDSAISAATFATWSNSANLTWSCAQVWVGTDSDAWPDGAKV